MQWTIKLSSSTIWPLGWLVQSSRVTFSCSKQRKLVLEGKSIEDTSRLCPPVRRSKIENKILVVVAIPLVAGIAFAGALLIILQQAERASLRESSARQAADTFWHLTVNAASVSTVLGGFLPEADIDRSLVKSEREAARELAKLEDLCRESPVLLNYVKAEKAKLTEYFALCREYLRLQMFGKGLAPLRMIELKSTLLPLMVEISNDSHHFQELVLADLHRGHHRADIYHSAARWVVFAGILSSVLVSVLMGQILSRQISSRLAFLADNSKRLALGDDLSAPVVTQDADQITALDEHFRRMAEDMKAAMNAEKELIETAPDVVFSVSHQLLILTINKTAEKLWRYSCQDILGTKLSEVCRTASGAALSTWFEDAKKLSSDCSFEAVVRTKDEQEIETLLSVRWVKEEERFFCVAHDIGDRKNAERIVRRSEERLTLLMDKMPVALILFDAAGRIIQANCGAHKLFGFPQDKLVQQHVSGLFPPEQFAVGIEFLEAFRMLIGGNVTSLPVLTASGDVRRAEASLDEIFFAGSQSFLLILFDVTDQHSLQTLRRDLVSMIAHDIATPLTTINVVLEMLTEGMLGDVDDARREELVTARKEISACTKTLRSLLSVEKFRETDLSSRAVVSLQSVVFDIAETLQSKLEYFDINLKSDMSAEPLMVIVHQERLVEAISGLISWLIGFVPFGCDIGCRVVEADGSGEVRFSFPFIDTAAFVSSEQFEYGLHLVIAQSLMQVHQGTLHLRPESLLLRLPLVAPLDVISSTG